MRFGIEFFQIGFFNLHNTKLLACFKHLLELCNTLGLSVILYQRHYDSGKIFCTECGQLYCRLGNLYAFLYH